jgi:hypothetical protein
LIVLAAVSVSMLIEAPLFACEEHAHVRTILDPLPTVFAGMRVEVHRTMGPQVVIANPTGQVLEVLDDGGTPFVRIGPSGVEGNLAAKAWYETYSPGAVAPAAAAHGSPPRWVRAASEPSFGWFEPRLDVKRAPLPVEVIVAGRSADLRRWSLPLRIDGEAVWLTGVFRYEPPPKGTFVARLTSPSRVAPGVRVHLLRGRTAGFLLQNSSGAELHVDGVDGEPFLRIGPNGVDANVRSRTWRMSARASDRRPAPAAGRTSLPDWQRVAAVPRFSWIDPRAQAPQATGSDAVSWSIPLRLDGQSLAVRGETVWKEH